MVPSNLLELEVFWSGLNWYSDGGRPLLIRQPVLLSEVFPWFQTGLLRKESLSYYCHKNSLLLWAMWMKSPHDWSVGLLLQRKKRKKMRGGVGREVEQSKSVQFVLLPWWNNHLFPNSPIAPSSTDWLLLCCSGKLIMALYFLLLSARVAGIHWEWYE